jgi:hypothetical protein
MSQIKFSIVYIHFGIILLQPYFSLIIKVLLSIDYDIGIFRYCTELQISIILLQYKLYLSWCKGFY